MSSARRELIVEHPGATIAEVTHHSVAVNGTELHYVSAGTAGSPVLLVHGFPESWWAFHKLIPILSEHHRVFAVDLRGFGDSAPAHREHSSAIAAADLGALIRLLNVGPIHLTGQDISGPTVFRVAASRPDLLRSLSAIETGLPGFGLEMLADVTHGGAWHIGVLAAPDIPEMLLAGRERAFIADYMFASLTTTPDAISPDDVAEFARTYARPGGFIGAAGLYRSLLSEGEDIRGLASRQLEMPLLAVGGGSREFTAVNFGHVAPALTPIALNDVGHYIAMEAPSRLADTLIAFFRDADSRHDNGGPLDHEEVA